jgi:hypothetical protein
MPRHSNRIIRSTPAWRVKCCILHIDGGFVVIESPHTPVFKRQECFNLSLPLHIYIYIYIYGV